MSRSDDPAQWNDGHAPAEQDSHHQAHPNSPHVPAQQAQPGYDPNYQPANPVVNPDPYASAPHAQVPQSQYADPAQQAPQSQQVPPSQFVDPVNYQQAAPVQQAAPTPQHPPQGQVPVEQLYTQNQPPMQPPQGVDPYQQATPQAPYPPQLDEIASQVQAASSLPGNEYAPAAQPAPEPYQDGHTQNTEMRHEHSIPSPGYTDEQSQYAQTHQPVPPQPHSGAAQQTAEELQAYFNQQAAAPAQDHSQYQTPPVGTAETAYHAPQTAPPQAPPQPPQPPQASDYDLGELMATEPAAQTYSQPTDHFSVSSDLSAQSQHVDFGQAPVAATPAVAVAHAGQQEYNRDVSHVADHFTQGSAGTQPSLEPAMQNDADFYAGEYADEEYEDYEEPRSRMGGIVKILATLSLAIITGAGLAYGYKFFASSNGGKKYPAIIRADGKPSKIKPSNPGGKQFAHSKKSIYSRVGDPGNARVRPDSSTSSGNSMPSMPGISLSGGPAIATSNSGASAPNGGVKRVRTVSVKPDGTYAPTKPLRPSKPANLDRIIGESSGASIPGISIGGSSPAPVVKPSRTAVSAKNTVTDELVRQIAKRAPAAKKPVVKLARVAPKLSAPVIGTSANGYVSQISARKSRIDALSAFADLRQRYGSVLKNSQPDIQEANLGSKGVWYRLRIGPPGSKQAATDICNKLKSAGHKGCFVRAY